MSKYCPIVKHKVTYQFCDDCDEKECLKHANDEQIIKDSVDKNNNSDATVDGWYLNHGQQSI